MTPEFAAFSAKVSALAPGLLEKSRFKLMKTRAPSAPMAPMPGTFGISTKLAMVHPEAQVASERMSSKKWKQVMIDAPASIAAGGVGYGIGRVLTELIGENMAMGGQRPPWVKHAPKALAALSMAGAFAGTQLRNTMKQRREEADR